MRLQIAIVILVSLILVVGGLAVIHRVTADKSQPYFNSMTATYTCSLFGGEIKYLNQFVNGEVSEFVGCFAKKSESSDFDNPCETDANCSGFCLPIDKVNDKYSNYRCSQYKKPIFYQHPDDLITKLP